SERECVQVAGELGARVARRRRHRLADRALQIERRETRYFVRLSLGEQLIEKNTEAVDVARGRDSRSASLPRASFARRQQARIRARQVRRSLTRVRLEQLRDPEIQQLRRAIH